MDMVRKRMVHKRMVHKVTLVTTDKGGRPTDVLPPLVDVQLGTLGNDALVLTGFERLKRSDGKEAEYAQSWWIRFEAA
jgi:hypothetical protein